MRRSEAVSMDKGDEHDSVGGKKLKTVANALGVSNGLVQAALDDCLQRISELDALERPIEKEKGKAPVNEVTP